MKYLLLCLCLLLGCEGRPGYYQKTGKQVPCAMCHGRGMNYTGKMYGLCMGCGGRGSVEEVRFVPTEP
jgi:DnaJ-class molecular chaperone